jgi:hypothetical protein
MSFTFVPFQAKRPWYLLDFFLFSLGGVRLSPLGISATIWPIVPAPDGRWWVWSSRWNDDWQGKPKYLEKPAPVPLCPPQNPHDLTWALTWTSAVGTRRLTPWAMARSRCLLYRRLSGPQSRSRRCGVERILMPPEIEPVDRRYTDRASLVWALCYPPFRLITLRVGWDWGPWYLGHKSSIVPDPNVKGRRSSWPNLRRCAHFYGEGLTKSGSISVIRLANKALCMSQPGNALRLVSLLHSVWLSWFAPSGILSLSASFLVINNGTERQFMEFCGQLGAHTFVPMSAVTLWSITLAARSKTRTVLARWNAGVVASNPTQVMDVCV